MKTKRKFRDSDGNEQVFCYLCGNPIRRFSTPEAERRFSESGLCERCQKQIGKEAAK
jgi:hypothetical protein